MISGLFLQPADDEDSFTDTDDECKEINFHSDFPINFNGEFHQKIFVSFSGSSAKHTVS